MINFCLRKLRGRVHVDQVDVVLLTNVLQEFRVLLESRPAGGGKRLGIRARIVDGDIDRHVPQIGAGVAFDGLDGFLGQIECFA